MWRCVQRVVAPSISSDNARGREGREATPRRSFELDPPVEALAPGFSVDSQVGLLMPERLGAAGLADDARLKDAKGEMLLGKKC